MSLKQKIKSNKVTIGSWVTIGHHSIVEILSSAGFDWLVIDIEHSPISIERVQELILTIHSKNIAALVRVGDNNEVIIKRVMDCGADGIIVPMVCTKSQAEKAVSSVRYSPNGKRGVGLARAQNYGIGFEKYKQWLENESIVIAQIEHQDGINNINDIINVDGIDSVIIGPYDLSASFGIPGELNNPIVLDAIKSFESECKKASFPFGYHIIKPEFDQVLNKIDQGYTFIGFSLDFFFLGEKARTEMKELKNAK